MAEETPSLQEELAVAEGMVANNFTVVGLELAGAKGPSPSPGPSRTIEEELSTSVREDDLLRAPSSTTATTSVMPSVSTSASVQFPGVRGQVSLGKGKGGRISYDSEEELASFLPRTPAGNKK
jgi:hypothetical protein